MADCPHLIWDANERPDHDGMVTERCRRCGATRKSIGSWWALKAQGKISANAMYDGSSFFQVSEPQSFRINNVDAILNSTLPPVFPFKEEREDESDVSAKRERRPHGFWKDNFNAVTRDIQLLGPDQARKKWRIPGSTWKLYLPQWIPKEGTVMAAVAAAQANTVPILTPKDEQRVKHTAASIETVETTSCDHPCNELFLLRGFRMAVQELKQIFRYQGVTKPDGNAKTQD